MNLIITLHIPRRHLRKRKSWSVRTVLFSFRITTTINEFLIDNIFTLLGWCVFEQTVGNSLGTDCVPLLADLFDYSYETDFIQGLERKNEKKLVRSFNFTFRYIDDVFSLNNCRLSDFVNRSYPIELEIKDTTDTAMFASYFDKPRNWQWGQVKNEILRPKR
jgi:hypothetical protein